MSDVNNFTDPEYQQWLDVQDEAAYWEAMHQLADECFVHIGRIDQIQRDQTKIIAANGWKRDKKYEGFVIPF